MPLIEPIISKRSKDDLDELAAHKLSLIYLGLESGAIIAGLQLKRTVFRSNHASNHLSLAGRLPTDKERFLALLDGALAGTVSLRPELFRGL